MEAETSATLLLQVKRVRLKNSAKRGHTSHAVGHTKAAFGHANCRFGHTKGGLVIRKWKWTLLLKKLGGGDFDLRILDGEC